LDGTVTDFVVAGTGSRSLRVADRAVQVEAMERCTAALEDREAVHGDRLVVMSGMAEGFDELIAVVALRLGIRLWVAIPNRGYLAYYWGRESQLGRDRTAEAQAIVGRAVRVTHVMEDVHNTTALKIGGMHANFWRNLFMVEQASEFLVWDPTSKGTAHCLREIQKAGKPYKILSPEPATLPIM
jgi:hypothetical protein